MTTAGWIFMVTSLLLVWGLSGWCFYRVLRAPPEDASDPGVTAP
jgi:hypothetical protein